LPRTLAFPAGQYALVVEGLSVSNEGLLFIDIVNGSEQLLATTNPLQIVADTALLP
jgi:hypothetical protein